MNPHQHLMHSFQWNSRVAQRASKCRRPAQLGFFWLALASCLFISARLLAAPTATNIWLGAGSTLSWNEVANWDAAGVPTATSFATLTNSGASGLPGTNGMGAVGTPNILITNDTTVGQLWFANSNYDNALLSYHTIAIDPGVTLTVSNIAANLSGSSNILQVMHSGGSETLYGGSTNVTASRDPKKMIYATVQGGAGSALVVNCTNGVTQWFQGNITVQQGALNGGVFAEPCNATLDLSGLENFHASINHLSVGADGSAGQFFFQRPRGTLWLAKTNTLVLLGTGTFPNEASTLGIWAGLIAQNNGAGTNHQGSIFLGLTNGVYCNTGIGLGMRGVSGFMGFNTNNPAGSSSAYFRGRTTARQTLWSLGDRTGTAASNNQDVRGEMDFSLGSVDAMVSTLRVGVSTVTTRPSIGLLEFGSGVIDVNSLVLGCQTVSGMGPAQGTITVSNTAILKVNSSAQIGTIAGSPVAGSYFGQIAIADGGSVQFANTAPITCGTGESDIFVDNGSSLSVFTVGTASAPLTTLRLAGSTLTVDRGTASNPTTGGLLFVNNLDLSGVNTINMLGPVLVVGQFPIIKYAAIINGNFGNLVLGATSPGVTGFLSNNVANSSIDFVVTSSTTTVLTWDGQTNSVNVGLWDIGLTPDWKGAQVYSQAAVPGSLVQFDDTATGTTTVTLNAAGIAPASLVVTNDSKNYTFDGTGSLTGPTALAKSGTGVLTLANSGTNTFAGGVFLNDGTLRIAGSGSVLPTSAAVTIHDVATASLDLNNVNLAIGSLTGAGLSGGNVTLGAGNLTINGGGGNYGGSISGSGIVIKTGSGTQTLTGSSTFTGGTIVSNGTLLVANSTGSGLGSGQALVAGGTLQLGDGVNNGSIAAATITNNGTLALNPGSSMVLTQVVYGTGSLLKGDIGAATPDIQITNANFYTGPSSVSNGRLQINHPNALGTGQINLGNQLTTLDELDLSGGITLGNNLVMPGRTGGVIPSPAALLSINDPFTGNPGTNTLLGTITLTGSTCYSLGADTGNGLIVAGSIVNSTIANPARFFLRGSGFGELRSGLPGNTTLEQSDGGGVWLLSGTNTYTGATIIGDSGTLIVNGAIKNSAQLSVGIGSFLAGTGFINCAVTNEGTISPAGADAVGTLTISNVLFSDSGTALNFDVSSTGNDQIRGMSTYVSGGVLTVNVLAPITGNCVFKLFDATNYSSVVPGTPYDAITLPSIAPLDWDTSYLAVDGTLHVTNGPAVTPQISSVTLGAGGAVQLSGTGTLVAPFDILATTNVALPLAQWDHIGGGTFSNGAFLFTDTAATNYPQRFYRLVTPVP